MRDSRVLAALADFYARSRAGRTGRGSLDKQVDFKELLRAASAETGAERAMAERDLEQAAAQGLISLERHPRDPSIIYQVRLPLEKEAAFFEALGRTSPTVERNRLAEDFERAVAIAVPEQWREPWARYFTALASAARSGGAIGAFSRTDLEGNAELMRVAAALLAWNGESLVRFVSCHICDDSKRLESLRPRLESILRDLSAGSIQSLEDIGILDTPRSCLIHGPVQFLFGESVLDLGLLQGPVRVSEVDIRRADAIQTAAPRCITVENQETFYELAKLDWGELLIQTSYPGSGTLRFIQRLPASMQFFHFGDSDPNGFEILFDLRRRTAREIRSLHMKFRPAENSPELDEPSKKLLKRLLAEPLMSDEFEALNAMLASGSKGRFEQESLGKPVHPRFPFYDLEPSNASLTD
jgi:hypothetical protein